MGYETYRNKNISTARGAVEIDVHATKKSTPIPTVVLSECKYWDKPVDQNVIYSFRSICADVGAHYGLIISKKGFQTGAHESREFTNIELLDFLEFQRTYFEEWRNGIFMRFAQMDGQIKFLLPGNPYYQHDTELQAKLKDVRVFQKYSVFFGDACYSSFFIERNEFPAEMYDPSGNPGDLSVITVRSPREYFDIGTQAVRDAFDYFSPDVPDKRNPDWLGD